jgi:hypothetical protein
VQQNSDSREVRQQDDQLSKSIKDKDVVSQNSSSCSSNLNEQHGDSFENAEQRSRRYAGIPQACQHDMHILQQIE